MVFLLPDVDWELHGNTRLRYRLSLRNLRQQGRNKQRYSTLIHSILSSGKNRPTKMVMTMTMDPRMGATTFLICLLRRGAWIMTTHRTYKPRSTSIA